MNLVISKKTVLVAIALLVGICCLVFGTGPLINYLNEKTVDFKLSEYAKSIDIYAEKDSSGGPVASLNTSGTIRLKPGRYLVTPRGDNIITDEIYIEIDQTTTEISVNPYFTEEYLSTAFDADLKAIQEAIYKKYPNTIKDFTLSTGKFYHFGDWYGATLYNTQPFGEIGIDTYGILLHKENSWWGVVGDPEIVFLRASYSTVPEDIIDDVNQMIILN